MLRKVFISSWYVIVVLLILLAFAVAIARGYPSLYQKYLPEIQTNLSAILGKPVQADSIRIDWHGITPLVTMQNLSIFEDDSEYDQLLNVDKAAISIDLYKSILQKKVAFKELTFIGGNLEAERTLDERIILNGIDISNQLAKRKESKIESKFKINLLNSSISIKDEIKNLNYFFDRVDIVLVVSGEKFKVTSHFTLPDTLGKSLSIIADIRNLDKGFKNIKGNLYTKGESINLELLSDFFPKLRVGIKKGFSNFEVWGDFDSLKRRTLLGHFSLTDLIYKNVQEPHINIIENEEITSLKTKFRLSGDINEWELIFADMSVQASNFQWPVKQFELNCKGCGQENFIVSAAMDYFHVDQLLSTIQHFPFITEKIIGLLDKVSLQGEMTSTKCLISINKKKLNKYYYKTNFKDVGISAPDQGITLSPISGMVESNHVHGSVELAADAVNIELNKLLNNPLVNQNINGLIRWRNDKNNLLFALQDTNLQSNEMNAQLQGTVQVNNKQAHVDIQIQVPEANANTIMQYLPYKRMKPKLSKWLSEAILDGNLKNGKLLFHGNPKNFPFKNKPGRFQVVAEVEDGKLNYRQDWPLVDNIDANFEINNKYLAVHAERGTILDSQVGKVTAEINDLKLPKLIVKGYAAGPANNIFQYLQQSSLLPEDSQIIRQLSTSGNTGLDLDLIITLTKKLEKELYVGGVIEFKDAGLKVNSLSLPFTDLQGKLNFDRYGAWGTGVTGKLYGLPVTASAEKLNEGRTEILVEGDLDLDTYLSTEYKELNDYVKGIAPVIAKVTIPKLDKNSNDKTLWVDVKSDLYGTSIHLPEPFKKEYQQATQLSVHTKHQKYAPGEIYASLNNQVFMKAVLEQQTSKLSRMEVRMGNEQFVLPEKGIKVSGRMKMLDLGQWRDVISKDQQKDIELNEVDLAINRVALGNLDFTNVDFNMRRNLDFWSGNVSSSIAKGTFEYPVNAESGSVATANFDYLHFDLANDKKDPQSTNLDPRSLPALVVNARSFEYKDAVFSDVSLKTKPTINGLTIDSLRGRGNDLKVSANGVWEVTEDNTQSTNLSITLKTDNMQNSLTGLGFDSAITRGEGTVSANFSWPKAPYQFSLSSVTGNANLRFNDGAISSVEPGGAGRIIGLVNLSEITRRLSLDFTDFFSKGYTFEKIRGDLAFKDANLTTQNLKVKGPSADILIQGRTGITAKDYDQIVTVTPHVSGGLPWIGLAVGGPIGAVGVAVAEKIAKSMGIDVDKVTQVQYSMKGSWEDPVIEPIAQKIAKENAPATQGQPAPQSQPNPNP
ncbi:MAG: YhdP family protein [Pseudomonadota bacterium]